MSVCLSVRSRVRAPVCDELRAAKTVDTCRYILHDKLALFAVKSSLSNLN